MQPRETDQIVYEHPLNEKTRTLLRLEHLFRQTAYYLPQDDTWASRAAVAGLIDMLAIFSRADIKADLIKELDRHRGKLAGIRGSRGIDDERLGQVLEKIESASLGVLGIQGQIGHALRENEFLKAIMQRSSIPGGSCAFDLPHYHYWLQQSAEARRDDLARWLSTLEPIRAALVLILSLVRSSNTPTREVAKAGIFQQTLDAQAPAQLVRVGLARDLPLFAEISGGKHRFTIRFLEPTEQERPGQTREDVDFSLTCCIL